MDSHRGKNFERFARLLRMVSSEIPKIDRGLNYIGFDLVSMKAQADYYLNTIDALDWTDADMEESFKHRRIGPEDLRDDWPHAIQCVN